MISAVQANKIVIKMSLSLYNADSCKASRRLVILCAVTIADFKSAESHMIQGFFGFYFPQT